MKPRFKKFLSFYRPYRKLFFLVLGAAIASAAIALLFPLFVRYITKDVLEGDLSHASERILYVGGIMLVLLAIQSAVNSYFDYKGHVMGAMMERDIRRELFEHYQKLSFRFYDHQSIAQLMSRITNDLFMLAELYHHGPEDLVVYLVKFIGAFVILLTIQTRLALTIFAFLPVMTLFVLYFNHRMRAATKISRERIGDINAQVEETLAGIRVVKSFANEAMESRKFERENNRFLASRKTIYGNESFLYQGMTAFTQLINVAMVVFGGIMITRASLALPDLITFLLYVGYLTEPIHKLTHITAQYQQGFAGFDRFMEIMETQPDIQDKPDAIRLQKAAGSIEFDHVSFRYGGNDRYVLQDIALTIHKGDYIALVGHSGAGKTTFCSLLPRFYELEEGRILLDGCDIRDIELKSLRENIGIVQQDVYLFSNTVLENIRFGRPDASREEIIEAAKMANAHDFIMALPQQYETYVGQHGVKLSGGQKQRLSIARVFLKDPPILILDEATSALDNESERVIHETLGKLSANRTTLVIAHRLSTIRNAHRIIVVENQRIQEQGTHEELMRLNGTYANLYRYNLSM